MNQQQRSLLLRVTLLGSITTLVLHVVVTIANGQNPISTPVSELSRGKFGMVQTFALLLFGVAHIALAIALGGLDRGRLWPWARILLVLGGIGNFYLAWYFMTAPQATLYGPDANDPLWILASITGIAMGAVQPGLARQARGLSIFAVLVLGIWLWLIPLILLVNEDWLGLYERIVGLTYVVWLGGVSYGLLRTERQ